MKIALEVLDQVLLTMWHTLPWLAGLVAVASRCANLPDSIWVPACGLLVVYAATQSGIFMFRTISWFRLESAGQR